MKPLLGPCNMNILIFYKLIFYVGISLIYWIGLKQFKMSIRWLHSLRFYVYKFVERRWGKLCRRGTRRHNFPQLLPTKQCHDIMSYKSRWIHKPFMIFPISSWLVLFLQLEHKRPSVCCFLQPSYLFLVIATWVFRFKSNTATRGAFIIWRQCLCLGCSYG